MNISFFTPIEGDFPICAFFNHIMEGLQGQRTLCAPIYFKRNEEVASFQDSMFCDFCRYETWMNACVEKLLYWQKSLEEYFGEYEGSWKYYAASKRLEFIEEFGPDDDELNPDGSIKTENLTDEEYKGDTIIDNLLNDDSRDIVRDATAEDIERFTKDIIAIASIDILQGFKEHFGVDSVEAYKEQDDGSYKLITPEENDMNMALGKVQAEDDATLITAIHNAFTAIFLILKSCQFNDDNTRKLRMIQDCIRALLGLDFNTMLKIVHEYNEEYGENNAQ